jgi:hypothetical protein
MRTILIGLYIACELIANVTASKPIQLGSIVVPAAIFIYTLTFTLIDLINESLGKHGAGRSFGPPSPPISCLPPMPSWQWSFRPLRSILGKRPLRWY